MKRVLYFFIFMTLVQSSSGQELLKFFINRRQNVVDSSLSDLIRVIEISQKGPYEFADYNHDQILVRSGTVDIDYNYDGEEEVTDYEFLLDGEITTYYPNSSKASLGNFKKNKKTGLFTEWYENDAIRAVINYEVMGWTNQRKKKLVDFYDSTGVQLVTNGIGESYKVYDNGDYERGPIEEGRRHGEWTGYFYLNDQSYDFKELYDDGKLVSGYSYDTLDNIYKYDKKITRPYYKTGMRGFFDLLNSQLYYPKDARKQKIEGEVSIKFSIDENGYFENLEIQKSLFPSLDQLLLQLVKKSGGDWTPGRYRGVVTSKFTQVIPVKFDLNGEFRMNGYKQFYYQKDDE